MKLLSGSATGKLLKGMEDAVKRFCFPLRFLAIFILMLLLKDASSGQTMEVLTRSGGVAIFGVASGIESLDALTRETTNTLAAMFNRGGRLRPVETYRLRDALIKVQERGVRGATVYDAAARLLNVDVYVIVSVGQQGGMYTGEMTMVPVSGTYPGFSGPVRVKSGIMMNIPLKLAMVIAEKHRGAALICRIGNTAAGGLKVLNAGQWHGIKEGTYRTKDGKRVEILSAGRYQSVARLTGTIDTSIIIPLYPNVDRLKRSTAVHIEENMIMKYGLGNTLLKSEDPERRYIEGMCIINPGSNICLPGYGSFLATYYLGFKDKSPDLPGVLLSTTFIAGHLLLLPVMTGFKGHFFPWVNDGDKSDAEQHLHVFLWATLPFTVSAAYLDQLAVQFQSAGILPPFFADRDVMAGLMSVLVPGGGLFYKGRRLAGWAYYLLELPLAGYGVYTMETDRKTGIAVLAATGGVKLLEIIHAVMSTPGYDVYRRETAMRTERIRIITDWRQGPNGDSLWRLGLAFSLDAQ